ncbi:MAG: hypothetical protein HN431_15995 [Bacteroidetes bacterium]|jgi:hypothetical protein|nr:hypothetical protein [Bacteroidota bacterium]
MIEKLNNGRSKVESFGNTLKITIPSKKKWFIILFLGAWLGGWFFGEKSAIEGITDSDNILADGFLLFWLAGWTVGGSLAILAILWLLFGSEIILLERGIIKISKGLFNTPLLSKSYEVNHIKNFRIISPVEPNADFFGIKRNMVDYLGYKGGILSFDYGMKTIKFGIAIDEAEAQYLVEKLGKKGLNKEE